MLRQPRHFHLLPITSATLLTLLLAACGGGGSSGDTNNASSSATSSSQGSSRSSLSSSSASSSSSSSSSAASSTSASSSSSAGNASCGDLASRIVSTQPGLPSLSAISDEYTPIALAPHGSNGSLIAWKERSATQIRVGRLAGDDKQFTSLLTLPGDEVHSMVGHGDGGALLRVANDPDIYSSKYCKGSATPNNAACQKMDLVRFDDSGNLLFTTTLTDKANVDSVGALFIWWYGHTGRLGWDGSRYAAYFRSATSTARPNVAGEIDIHAGDTMRMVDANGNRLATGGWQWGCSHSWSVRLAHNSSGWAALCHGDAYPNAMRMRLLDNTGVTSKTWEWLSGSEPTQRALGGVVADSDGYWLTYLETSGSLRLRLAKVSNAGSVISDQIVPGASGIDSGYPFRAWLGRNGKQLVLGWKSGSKLMLQAADASSGALIGSPVSTSASISNFDEFTTLANGDLLFAHAPASGTVTLTRVKACQ